MRILVVGSLTGLSADAEDAFKAACSDLGKAIGKRGHSIIVCSDHMNHADPHVLRGFIQTGIRGRSQQSITVTFGDPADDENSPGKFQSEKQQAASRFTWIDLDTSGDYPFNRIGVIKEADVVIMIGGARARDICLLSPSLLERHWFPFVGG